MNWLDHARRTASVVLVAVLLVAVPAIAQAKFSASRSSGLTTSTDRLETPSNLTGSYRCTRSGSTETISVTITSFADVGPSTTYGYGLLLGASVKDVGYSTSRTQRLDGSRSYDGASTTWTVAVQGYLSRWTSEIGTEHIVCPANASKTGTF